MFRIRLLLRQVANYPKVLIGICTSVMYRDDGLSITDDSSAYGWADIAITMAQAGKPHALPVFKYIHGC